MLNSLITLALAASLTFSQATAPKPALKPSPDTWERSKECAAQAEKVVAERKTGPLIGGNVTLHWQNHYSPTYNRCFLRLAYFDGAATPMATLFLIDAFERSELAESVNGFACRAAGKSEREKADCEELIQAVTAAWCSIGNDRVDSAKAQFFINGHTKD